MRLVGNLFWFLFAGLWLGLGWALAGILWCITIVGIPWGLQCFKFAKLTFTPFGKAVFYGGGLGSLLANILWLCLSGLPLCLEALLIGGILCITVVGIPFGMQCFKYAKLALMPFGASVSRA